MTPRGVVAIALSSFLLGACQKDGPPSAVDAGKPPDLGPVEPVPSASVAAVPSTPPAPKGVDAGPLETAPREAREKAVLELLAGEGPAADLPIVATEPGETLNPALRDSLAPRKGPPKIRQGKVTVKGALPREVIQRIMRRRFAQLRRCYQRGLDTNPQLAGNVNLKLTIGAEGAVAAAQTTGSSLPSKSVLQCIAAVAKSMRFPKPEKGVVVATVPLTLTP